MNIVSSPVRAYGGIQGSWFIWYYLTLMCITPLINPIFQLQLSITTYIPLLVLSFGWSYLASTVPIIKNYLPSVNGFGGFGIITFIGIYVVGRISRIYNIKEQITPYIYIGGFTVCIFMVMIGFHHYCSPFNIGIVILLFNLFLKLPEKCIKLEKVFIYLGPSMLSVYLIHNSRMGLYLLRYLENNYIQSHGYYIIVFIVTINLFIGSILIDLPRRLILYKK